jgi:probable rRNA maturation factor
MSQLAVSVARRVRSGWLPATRDFQRWAGAALGARALGREISVLLVGLAASRALNVQYRGRDRATNVLSFPAPAGVAGPSILLGDLVICPAVLRAEARAQHKSARAHWTHLVVHGVLHLAGYDHERDAEARRMERREIIVLRRLGVANPYLTARRPARARPVRKRRLSEHV